jgi:hypothetical protein
LVKGLLKTMKDVELASMTGEFLGSFKIKAFVPKPALLVHPRDGIGRYLWAIWKERVRSADGIFVDNRRQYSMRFAPASRPIPLASHHMLHILAQKDDNMCFIVGDLLDFVPVQSAP